MLAGFCFVAYPYGFTFFELFQFYPLKHTAILLLIKKHNNDEKSFVDSRYTK